MTHKSKLIKLLAVLFAFTLVAAACGDDDGGDSSASSSDEVTLTAEGGSLLETVQERGTLNCGVSGAAVAFSTLDPAGNMVGFDADFCRAVAAAVRPRCSVRRRRSIRGQMVLLDVVRRVVRLPR